MANVKKARVLRLLFCDFCGTSQEFRVLLIQGRDEVHICEQCVGQCADMVLEFHRQGELKLEARQSVAAVDPSDGITTD